MADAYIAAIARSAGGRRGGRMAGWHPTDLAGAILRAVVDRAGADPALVEDVIMGCACPGGEQGANIGRYAALAAGFPDTVPGTTVDRQCGSSQQALHFAAATVMAGLQDVVIAAGVESMTRVPMGLPWTLAAKHGFGTYRSPGLDTRFGPEPFSQFSGAEMLAGKYGMDRETLDRFALESHDKAAAAADAGRFADEIVPLAITLEDGTTAMHDRDEGIRPGSTLEKIGSVKTLQEGGRITAANASQICDGAAALLVCSEAGLKATGATPLARIHHMSVLGGDARIMLDTPIAATARALAKAGMTIDDIDLYEVNEAFAPVPLAWLQETGADPAKLNINGGAIALGHPLGASGAKLMATLISALHQTGGRYGLQTMCEAGGMANVTIVERP
ncbi:acetyl-CoA C-acetyltransferase [Sphingomonas solaris]|uniref:Acetyl-CoA C-acyltransferase n=1 Tax=Alterirhizorhabdus solaris TaxID=2529389 RepID=A0A558RD33_9SPHN|nr:acetyl-CoA C-acetyltransferase [Sphingomonas solaris]TVV77278.1 acetyl-CoA C-acyltransferase [Sphingomonas solaris]